jgi:3',5'-cyclic AMP phosphodiesterase CpdA
MSHRRMNLKLASSVVKRRGECQEPISTRPRAALPSCNTTISQFPPLTLFPSNTSLLAVLIGFGGRTRFRSSAQLKKRSQMRSFGEMFQKVVAKVSHWIGETTFDKHHKQKPAPLNNHPDEIDLSQSFDGYPLKFVHISDLHFGRVHSEKLEHLKKRLESIKPHLILITGDTVDSPSKQNFGLAKDFLAYLSTQGWNYFLVPGNHDRHGEIDLEKWCAAFGMVRGTYDCKLVKLGQGAYVTIFLLDSTIAHYESSFETTISNALQVKGRIDDPQLHWIRSTHKWLLDNRRTEFLNSFKIAALHHHPVPTTTKAETKDLFLCLENAGEVLDCFSKLQIDVVLHGHQHDPTIQMLSRHDPYKEMTILGAGTALRESDKKEEQSFSLSKETSFYVISMHKDKYNISEHTYANNLPITNKFCPTRGVQRNRTIAGQLPHELDMFWTIHFPSTDFACREIHTFRDGADGTPVTEFPFMLGFTTAPGQTPPMFTELGCKIKRTLNGKEIAVTFREPQLISARNWEGKPYSCYEVKAKLDPPLAQGINDDVLEMECIIPQGCWELKTANYFESGFQFGFTLNRFSLNVEFEGTKAIKRLTMLPLPETDDEGVYVWQQQSKSWSKASDTTAVVSNKWKYEQRNIPPMMTIYFGITRT